MNVSIGPFIVKDVSWSHEGGHGGYGRVVLKRQGFEDMLLYMEPDEAKALQKYVASDRDISRFEARQDHAAVLIELAFEEF